MKNLPWHECVTRYDRPHTFHYADPPCWQTEGCGVDLDWGEYERLAEMMRTCMDKVMFSINDHPDIRAIFAKFQTHELEIKYSNGNQAQGAACPSRELVVTNWDASNAEVLFQRFRRCQMSRALTRFGYTVAT